MKFDVTKWRKAVNVQNAGEFYNEQINDTDNMFLHIHAAWDEADSAL